MADPIAVANKRAFAEERLFNAADSVSARFGIEIIKPTTPIHISRDLYTAELLESVAELLERVAAQSDHREQRERRELSSRR